MGRGEHDSNRAAASHHVSCSACSAASLIPHLSSHGSFYIKGCGMSWDAAMDGVLKLQNVILGIPPIYMCYLSPAVSQ